MTSLYFFFFCMAIFFIILWGLKEDDHEAFTGGKKDKRFSLGKPKGNDPKNDMPT